MNVVDICAALCLCAMAGTAKAARDTIKHHWAESWFSYCWNINIYNWLHSEWNYTARRQNKLGRWLWFLWDGWHFFDTASYVFLLAAAVFLTDRWQVAAGFVCFGAAFEIFYEWVLVRK